ncbi:N/A [soil metagenome]|jgi:LCP family protein required for cell wall assembly
MGVSRIIMRMLGASRRYWKLLSAVRALLPFLSALVLASFLFLLNIIGWPALHAPNHGVHKEQGERHASGQADHVEEDEKEDEKLNVLLIGYDSRDDLYLSDVLMVAQFDEDSGKVKLLSIPRDFYVQIPNAREPYQKINAAYAISGPELTVETVEKLTSIPIDHYAAVDFKGFTKAIDAVGGIPVDVENNYYERGYSKIDLHPGRQTLSGEQALSYVRFRHDPRGDLGRIERQQKLLSALMEKVVSLQGVRGIPELVHVADEYVKDDLSRTQMLALAWKLREVQRSGTVKSVTLKGTPASLEDKGSVLIPNDRKNDELISPFRKRSK